MTSSIPLEIAETISTASINQHPSLTHDLNPSTAASAKVPVTVSNNGEYDGIDDDEMEDDDDEIPEDVVRPLPRKANLPPLPDLRFEQSYLASIAGADTYWRVGWITVRDQVFMALAQGFLTSLAFAGWKHWNANAQLSGSSAGARLRRWWYKTNNWPVKEKLQDKKLAKNMGDFYKYETSGGD